MLKGAASRRRKRARKARASWALLSLATPATRTPVAGVAGQEASHCYPRSFAPFFTHVPQPRWTKPAEPLGQEAEEHGQAPSEDREGVHPRHHPLDTSPRHSTPGGCASWKGLPTAWLPRSPSGTCTAPPPVRDVRGGGLPRGRRKREPREPADSVGDCLRWTLVSLGDPNGQVG